MSESERVEPQAPEIPAAPAAQTAPEQPPESPSVLGVIATILLGLVLIVALVPLILWIDYGAHFNEFEMSAPPAGAMGLLFALLAVNALVYLVAKWRAFRRWQVVLLYVMLVAALPVMNVGLVQPVFSNVTAVASEKVNRLVPSVSVAYAAQHPAIYPKIEYDDQAEPEVRERQIKPLKRYWAGVPLGLQEQYLLRDAGTWERIVYAWNTIPWGIWKGPLLNWGIFILMAFAGILFLVEILRQEWVERENLAFPLAVLPTALLEESAEGRARHPLLANPLLWIGMAIPVLMMVLSGLRYYALREIPFGDLRIDFNVIFTKPPMDAIKQNMLVLSPLLIGVGYLVHLEVSRSIWIFFFVGAVFLVLAVSLGWSNPETPPERLDWRIPQYPYPRDQGIGALLALAVFMLWRSRGGLWAVLKAPFARRAVGQGDPGFMPRRLAGWGFVVSFALMVWWMGRMFRVAPGFDESQFGALNVTGSTNYLLIVLYLGVFFLMVVGFARIRAEAGVPSNFLMPTLHRIPRVWGGPRVFGWRSSNFVSHYAWMGLSTLPALAPLQLESLVVARRHGPSARTVGIAVVLALVAALVVGGLGFLWCVHLQGEGYTGKSHDFGTDPFWLMYKSRGKALDLGYFHRPHAIACLVGLGLMAALLVARSKWMRFPLHPLGYLVYCLAPLPVQFGTDSIRWKHALWAPMLIAWFLKRTFIRYGGMKLYRRLLPIFLGMILGSLLMYVFWNAAHLVMLWQGSGETLLLNLDRPVYRADTY